MATVNQYVYIASSWRNPYQQAAIHMIRAAGIECYDFKDSEGFHWSEVDLDSKNCTFDEYIAALDKDRALNGFSRDFDALIRATHCLLILPSNRSAHLEAGFAIGEKKSTCIWIPDGEFDEPELMYLMADRITNSALDVLDWLEVKD